MTFKLTPSPAQPNPQSVELFASLNLDDKDELTAKFKKLVRYGMVAEFDIERIALGRAKMFDSIIKCIREIQEGI